jgi:hypothetical protein
VLLEASGVVDAFTQVSEAADLYRGLAADGTAAALADLAQTLEVVVALLSGLDRGAEAISVLREVASLYEVLATSAPAEFQADYERIVEELDR